MTWRHFALGAALMMALTTPVLTQNLPADLQRAKQLEAATGDCKLVMAEYTRIAEQGAKTDRAAAAQALLRLGLCQEKMGDGDARSTLSRVATTFKDQREFADEASRRLTALAAKRPGTTNPQAGPAARFVTAEEGELSPDGRLLAVWHDFKLVTVDLSNGNRSVLIPAQADEAAVCHDVTQPFVWSRDSKRIAYLWCFHPGGDAKRRTALAQTAEDGWAGRELRTIGVDGKQVATILSQVATEPFGFTGWDRGLVDWSVDGETILLSAKDTNNDDVFGLVTLRTGKVREVQAGRIDRSWVVRFSPDGSALAYTQRRVEKPGIDIFVLNLGSGKVAALYQSSEFDNRLLDWTPAGNGILFLSNRRGTWDVGLVHMKNGQPADIPVWLARDIGLIEPRALTPAGTFTYRVPAGTIYGTSSQNLGDVYIVATDPETGRVQSAPALVSQKPGHTSRPVWSRDGRLAFKSGAGGAVLDRLSILTVTSGREEQLGTTITSPRFDWSPDGRFFLQGRQLQLIDASTGAATTIREGTGGELPRFFPDGKSVVYRVGQRDLMRLDLSSRDARSFVTMTGNVSIANYALAPDGHAAALVIHDWTANKRDIRILDIATGEMRSLVPMRAVDNPGDKVAWSPDSRYLVYADATADTAAPGTAVIRNELWRIRESGGAAEKLGLTFDDIEQIAIAPDGRHLAFYFERRLRPGVWAIDRLLPVSEVRKDR